VLSDELLDLLWCFFLWLFLLDRSISLLSSLSLLESLELERRWLCLLDFYLWPPSLFFAVVFLTD
jgi:hypothetical protein